MRENLFEKCGLGKKTGTMTKTEEVRSKKSRLVEKVTNGKLRLWIDLYLL